MSNIAIDTQPLSQLVKIGAAAAFSVTAHAVDHTSTIYYQWLKDDHPIQGQTSSTLTFSSVTPDDANTYSCQIHNNGDATTEVTNRVVLASSMLDNIELNMKILMLGMTITGGYNFNWQVVNQDDEAVINQITGGDYPRSSIESPAETNIDSPNAPDAQSYTNEVVFVINVKGSQAWSNNANFTIRSNLRLALDDLKMLFGGDVNGNSVNDSCEIIIYRSSQVIPLNQNDIQRPGYLRTQWLVRYCQDRIQPIQRSSS